MEILPRCDATPRRRRSSVFCSASPAAGAGGGFLVLLQSARRVRRVGAGGAGLGAALDHTKLQLHATDTVTRDHTDSRSTDDPPAYNAHLDGLVRCS